MGAHAVVDPPPGRLIQTGHRRDIRHDFHPRTDLC
jgi:hypothetical protein